MIRSPGSALSTAIGPLSMWLTFRLRSRGSGGGAGSMRNGLCTVRMKSRKTGAHCAKNMAVGTSRAFERRSKAAISVEKIAHMRNVPSCPPQNEEKTYLKSCAREE